MSTLHLAVVGGGPAGLRAAEVAATHGAKVTLFDAKPSVGRKFLVAGKGGLNLTHEESLEKFVSKYGGTADRADAAGVESLERWAGMLGEFGPQALRAWAEELGVETFAATSGRVYPKEMKSAPLLRRWLGRLRSAGVQFLMRHRLQNLSVSDGVKLDFEVNGELVTFGADAVVLALGGGSWPETGSDGGWVRALNDLGVRVSPLKASNCGWEADWTEAIRKNCEGMPLKNVQASAGGVSVRGELLLTRYGLEGGIVYALSSVLRAMTHPALVVDFKPDSSEESLVARLGSTRRNFLEEAVRRWRLEERLLWLFQDLRRGLRFSSGLEVARFVKNCPISLRRPRPLSEAISTAGGVEWSEVNGNLMLHRFPGVFVAGEMLDWDAPTGGYLMQGCFASGTRAGVGALKYLERVLT